MEQVLVSQTKDYLILKIPLVGLKKRRVVIDDPEKIAIEEGLKAVKEGRITKPFDYKGAIGFLNS